MDRLEMETYMQGDRSGCTFMGGTYPMLLSELMGPGLSRWCCGEGGQAVVSLTRRWGTAGPCGQLGDQPHLLCYWLGAE